jgi:3-phosphoshikimate 1-carboxyvinyltransferase
LNVEVIKPVNGGEIKAIPSKSQAHRLLICAALADGGTYIECGETSDDIDATVRCLNSLGASVTHDGAGFAVKPLAAPASSDVITQDCGESGSTLRFMLPVCCALGATAEFIMRGRLPERPMMPLLKAINLHGCEFSATGNNLRCSGQLTSGVFELPGDVSSQFTSGLLLALPLLGDDSVLIVEGKEESRRYASLTLDALGRFNIRIERKVPQANVRSIYVIKRSEGFRSPGKASVDGDWSNAAFWLCAGAIGGNEVTCSGLNLGSRQGDMAILRLLERFGADVAYEASSVTVKPSGLRGIEIDASDVPDLVPALSVVAAVAEGDTLVYSAGRLRMKESDRLASITAALRDLGADVDKTHDGLIIRGKKALSGGTTTSFGDHRIAMMAAIASTVCENPVTIKGAEAVNKSYPGFFRDFEKLGGVVRSV